MARERANSHVTFHAYLNVTDCQIVKEISRAFANGSNLRRPRIYAADEMQITGWKNLMILAGIHRCGWTARLIGTRLDDVELATQVKPFDILLPTSENTLDVLSRLNQPAHHVVSQY